MAALKCWLQEMLAKEIGLALSRRRGGDAAASPWRRDVTVARRRRRRGVRRRGDAMAMPPRCRGDAAATPRCRGVDRISETPLQSSGRELKLNLMSPETHNPA